MRKLYHTPEEKREAQRGYDRKRQQTEHRRAYDRDQYRKHHPSPIVQLPLIPLSRVCLTCGAEKDLEKDFNKQGTGKFGYRAHCKECQAKQRKEESPRQEWVEVSSKICPRCEPPTEKKITEFSTDKRRKDKHAGWCKECISKWGRSEERKAAEREYRKDRRRDPEKSKHIQESQNRWRRKHPEKQQELTMRRNARKKAATTERVSYKHILERDGYWCYICQKPIDPNARKRSPESLTYDHIIPLQPRPGEPQGTHSASNIKPSHKVCNARKGRKPLDALTPFDRSGP